MHRTASDLLILTMIAIPVSALMLLTPRADMHVERNWGSIFYSEPVSREEATELADLFVDQGLFVGNPMSLKLERDGQVWTLMMVLPRDYSRLNARETLAAFAHQICSLAFPGMTASFVCVDDEFQPFDELLPPTHFPDSCEPHR